MTEIPANLTNEQIRKLLEKDLSKAELKEIARQRSIYVGTYTNEEIKRRILRNLERQEGYARLSRWKRENIPIKKFDKSKTVHYDKKTQVYSSAHNRKVMS